MHAQGPHACENASAHIFVRNKIGCSGVNYKTFLGELIVDIPPVPENVLRLRKTTSAPNALPRVPPSARARVSSLRTVPHGLLTKVTNQSPKLIGALKCNISIN